MGEYVNGGQSTIYPKDKMVTKAHPRATKGREMTRRGIIEMAKEFREGMLSGKPSDAMCFALCSALVSYFKFQHIDCELIEGAIGDWNHFWIKLSDASIIDPTADQFKRPDGNEMPKVYYGKKPHWYK